MVYRFDWKRNFCDVPAETVGRHMENLQKKKGEVTCENLLDSARPEESPIHPCYEWNDSVAAEKYRLTQSHRIIRNLVCVAVAEKGEQERPAVRAFVNTVQNNGYRSGRYVDVNTAMSHEETRKIVLKNALRELKNFREKYRDLSELSGIFAAIDNALKELEGRQEVKCRS